MHGASHRQSEVVLVFAVDCVCKVLVASLRQTVLLIQDVQNAHQFGLHQVYKHTSHWDYSLKPDL